MILLPLLKILILQIKRLKIQLIHQIMYQFSFILSKLFNPNSKNKNKTKIPQYHDTLLIQYPCHKNSISSTNEHSSMLWTKHLANKNILTPFSQRPEHRDFFK